MTSSGLLRRVAFVKTDVSEELNASIKVTRVGELGKTLAVTGNRRTLRTILSTFCLPVTANVVPSLAKLVTLTMEELGSSKTPVLTRGMRRNIPEDGIFNNKLVFLITD
jgi:hypothetical protein